MREVDAVFAVRRAMGLVAFGLALAFVVLGGSDARAAGPLSPVQTWTEQFPDNHPSAQLSGSMAFDPSTGQTVLFGGTSNNASSNQTWIWDGTDWTRKFPATSPYPRGGAAMAFDKKSGNILMFGGTSTGAYFDETWSWDGTNWTELNPVTRPSARYEAGMAYDSANGEIVLFGGARDTASAGSGVYLNDTWTWNGTNWTQETPVNQPPAGFASRMEFDPGLGRVMVNGIFNETTSHRQTWTWNGSNWSELVTATSPAISNGSPMEYNPTIGKMVLFGGVGNANTTWTFDGTDWSVLSTPNSPPVRQYGAMSYDPAAGRMLLFGGYGPSGSNPADTWYFGPPPGVGSNWNQLMPATSPPVRTYSSMAFDPGSGEMVLFGGVNSTGTALSDTWTWNGSTWTQESPAVSPSPRARASMAFDPGTGQVVLFGGTDSNGNYFDQTWTWDGTNWTQRTPVTSPSVRAGATMAYDEGSGEMVLFGGGTAVSLNNTTWVWTGTNWNLRTPPHSPPARDNSVMTFDQASGRILLFGGFSGTSTNFNDTWTWNGSDWIEQDPQHRPFGPQGASMSFNPSAGNTLLFGGTTGSGFDSGTWEWDGTNWYQQNPDEQPEFRMGASMDFDPTLGEVLLFGGQTENGLKNDTWSYALQVGKPTAEISDPAFGQEIPVGSSYATSFSCEEAPGGPGLASCEDDDGASSPGQLDTSTAGEHIYEVIATSQSGQTGVTSIPYDVEKAEAQISVSSVPDAIVGDSVVVSGTLTDGYNPAGDITFRAYGPDDATCSGTPVFESSSVVVTGNDSYASTPGFEPDTSGVYRWVAEYSGDSNNDDEESTCGDAGTVLTVTKHQPTLTTSSATDAEAGGTIMAKATLVGGFEPTGSVVFRAYGPDNATCSGTPAFESSAVPVTGNGDFTSPAFAANEAGSYRWVAAYSGNTGNEPVSTTCGAEGSISTVSSPADVCPVAKPGLRLVGFGLKPPFGNSEKVMGVRVGFISRDAVIKVKPSISYRLNGRKLTVKLKARTVNVNRRSNLRFRAPSSMKKDFRRAGVPLGKAKVTFAVKATIRPGAAPAECFRNIGTRKLKTRVAEVAGRVALRRG